MKYVVAVLAVLLMGLGVKYHFLTNDYAKLKLDYKTAEANAITEKANALQAQADEHSNQIQAEQNRRAALAKSNADLRAKLETLKDYNEKAAESIRLFVNGMLDRANGTGKSRENLPTSPDQPVPR